MICLLAFDFFFFERRSLMIYMLNFDWLVGGSRSCVDLFLFFYEYLGKAGLLSMLNLFSY